MKTKMIMTLIVVVAVFFSYGVAWAASEKNTDKVNGSNDLLKRIMTKDFSLQKAQGQAPDNGLPLRGIELLKKQVPVAKENAKVQGSGGAAASKDDKTSNEGGNGIGQLRKFAEIFKKDPLDVTVDGIIDQGDIALLNEMYVVAVKHGEHMPEDLMKVYDLDRDGVVTATDSSIAAARPVAAIELIKAVNPDKAILENWSYNAETGELKCMFSLDANFICPGASTISYVTVTSNINGGTPVVDPWIKDAAMAARKDIAARTGMTIEDVHINGLAVPYYPIGSRWPGYVQKAYIVKARVDKYEVVIKYTDGPQILSGADFINYEAQAVLDRNSNNLPLWQELFTNQGYTYQKAIQYIFDNHYALLMERLPSAEKQGELVNSFDANKAFIIRCYEAIHKTVSEAQINAEAQALTDRVARAGGPPGPYGGYGGYGGVPFGTWTVYDPNNRGMMCLLTQRRNLLASYLSTMDIAYFQATYDMTNWTPTEEAIALLSLINRETGKDLFASATDYLAKAVIGKTFKLSNWMADANTVLFTFKISDGSIVMVSVNPVTGEPKIYYPIMDTTKQPDAVNQAPQNSTVVQEVAEKQVVEQTAQSQAQAQGAGNYTVTGQMAGQNQEMLMLQQQKKN